MATFIFKRKEYVAPLLIAGANVAGGALGFMGNSKSAEAQKEAIEAQKEQNLGVKAQYQKPIEIPEKKGLFSDPKNFSVLGLAKGIGSGLVQVAKANKKTLVNSAKTGAVMAGGLYGVNKVANAINKSNEGEYNGMSTGKKVATGIGATAAGAIAYDKMKKAPQKALDTANKSYQSATSAYTNAIKNKSQNMAEQALVNKQKATSGIEAAKNKLANFSKPKALGKAALVTAGIAGTAYLGNKLLKNRSEKVKAQQSEYSEPLEQRQYSPGFVKLGLTAGKYAINAIKGTKGAWGKAGQAAKLSGQRMLDKGSNFMSLGLANNKSTNTMLDAVAKNSGSTVNNFINNHKTAARNITKVGLAGAGIKATDMAFNAGQKVANKAIGTVDSDYKNTLKEQNQQN
jgi:hypothetical protein